MISIDFYRRLILPAMLLACVSGHPVAQEEVNLPAEVEAVLHSRIASGDHPGFVIGTIDARESHVYGFGSLGVEHQEPPDADTRYEIGSVTKVFTALLLVDAVERGEVRLDDPVARYLPDDVLVPGGAAMTLAHLAEHTSGLPRMPMNLRPSDPENLFADYSARGLYAFLSAYTLPRIPGEEYEYSNLGMGLLGHVLARQAGMSYEALVDERINRPLGLDATGITLGTRARAHLAPGHNGGRRVTSWDFDVLAGCGALRSTAGDMLRLLSAHLGFVETPLNRAIGQVVLPRVGVGTVDGDPLTVGLGWHIRETDMGRVIWHNGGTGGYSSFVGFNPGKGRGVVVLTNGNTKVDDIGFHLLDPSIPLETARATVEVASATLGRYVGRYQLISSAIITVTREKGRLYGRVAGQPAFALYPASDTRFFFKGADAEIEFNVDETDTVTGLTLYQRGMRIPAGKVK